MIANSPIPADVPLASPETGPIIEVRDLVKTFGRRTVLNGISFKVLQGETMVIMGGSKVSPAVTSAAVSRVQNFVF